MSLEDVRITAQTVADRAKNDPEYQAALLNDPIGVLTAAGVPADFAQQLVGGDAEPDTQGYLQVQMPSCNDTTCWTSGCPGSCAVTICGSTQDY